MASKITEYHSLRNVAVIAHVDHGKTTLVDALLRQCGAFHEKANVPERVMDRYDLERERGITILAKNAAIFFRDVKINLVDTPGHADFGGEVERALHMADGVLLVVDGREGPMPQTRFVLRKALAMSLKALLIINKVDRADCDPDRALNQVFDLFVELGASDEQLDFQVVYTSATEQWARRDLSDGGRDMTPLLESIIESIAPPAGDANDPFRMLVSNIDYNEYLGRLAIGRVHSGRISTGMAAVCLARERADRGAVERLFNFKFLERETISSAEAGEIVAVAGFAEITVGDTLAAAGLAEGFPPAFPIPVIDPPTITMNFGVNTGAFAGREGRYLTSRHLKARLERECWSNVALRVEPTDAADVMRVSGRGLLHLGILIEQMRREGYELEVSQPRVILREQNGQTTEPVEEVAVEVPKEFVGAVMEILGARGGTLKSMDESAPAGRVTRGGPATGTAQLAFVIPSRGLIGARSRLMSATRGEAMIYHAVCGYEPIRQAANVTDADRRTGGVLVSSHTGAVTAYALLGLQDRGRFFVQPGDEVYEGMLVGESAKPGEISLNVTRAKHMTNVRSSTKELTIKLKSSIEMGLEDALEYIAEDEVVEVTPGAIRLRKRILRTKDRQRAGRRSR